MINIHIVVCYSSMLIIRFPCHGSRGSGEDFLRVFTIHGQVDHLGNLTWIFSDTHWFPLPIDASYKNQL